MTSYIKYITFITTLLTLFSCVEEIELQTETIFEDVLVVEAKITNEFKQQEILLSRTYELESEGPAFERNATIKIIEGDMYYDFYESTAGTYVSNTPFAAKPNVNYKLEIVRSNGDAYESTVNTLTQQTQIDDVFFERGFNENEEEGVSVFVDSFDPTGNSKYYRFEYEETYKIVAPDWVETDMACVRDDIGSINFVFSQRSIEELVCYNTVKSNTIIITNTNALAQDKLEQFRVRFINRDNYIMSHRYSIQVKQYVISEDAYRYYRILKDISSSESVLSQNQVGHIEGNIYSLGNPNEKVLGYFEVASVDIKRIYFNYTDLFPNEFLPPYIISCVPFSPDIRFICDALSESQGNKYYGPNLNPDPSQSFVYLIAGECGNCKVLGTHTPPDFWEE